MAETKSYMVDIMLELVTEDDGKVKAVRIRGKQTKHRIRKKTIREWIRNGTWFSAEEAVAAGLCDGLMSRTDFERGG